MLPSLARRNPLVKQFLQKTQHYCRRFLFFFGNSSLSLGFFVWLFVNLMMREQTLITGFSARFTFIELALRRVPIFTRRSCAGTFQKISARLSKKGGTMVTSASDTSLPRHTSSA